MYFATSLLAAAVALPAFVAARVATPTRQEATSIDPGFCSVAVYDPSDPYPYGFPIGGGICAGLVSDLGTCYNWASFPASVDGGLVNNLTYLYVPLPYQCVVYKNDDCEGSGLLVLYGGTDLSNPELSGDVTYNKAVNSWLCTLS